MALSSDDIQRIIDMGGIKINLHTGSFGPAIYPGSGGLQRQASDWLNSNRDSIDELIQKYPDVIRPPSENTHDSNIFGILNTPAGAAMALAAMLAPAIAPSLMAEFGGATVGSELTALQADAAIQAGLGASAASGAGATGLGTVASSEIGSELGALTSDAAIQSGTVAGADATLPGALASETAGESTVAPDVLANTSPQDLANALRSSDVTSSTDLGLTGNETSNLSSFTTPSDTSYLDNYSVNTSTPTSTPISTDTLPVSSDITSPQDLANALRNTDVTIPSNIGLTGNEASNLTNFTTPSDVSYLDNIATQSQPIDVTVPQNIGLTGNEATDLSSFTTPTDTSYLNDYAPTDTGTAQIGSGTSLSPDAANNKLSQFYNVANPETQANLGTVSNLVGGGAESNLATLDSLSNPLLPTTGAGIGGAELGATGSIIGSGEGLGTQTLTDTLAPTGLNGLTVNDLNSQPLLNNGTVSTTSAKDVADALRRANQLKNLLSSNQQLVKNQQTLQQSQALGNLLKTNQFTPIATPEVYKAKNPFTFSPQEPIQGNPLASLLRNNYGNS